MGTEIEFDTPFLGDDIYTRANAGEVFPHLLAPLAWTLLGPSIERGFMRCMSGDFAAVEPRPDGYLACGRMAGRLHLNLSVFRTVAERAPGSSAHDLDIQYFGDAVASGLPAHPDERVPLTTTVRCTAAAVGTMAGFGRRVRRQTRQVAGLAERRRLAFASGEPSKLLETARGLLPAYEDLFGTHVTARALTSSAVSLATGALVRQGLSAEQALQLVSDLPDLESAKPSKHLQALAGRIEDPATRQAVRDGLTWAQLATSSEPGATDLRSELSLFIDKFGHRGVNEFDPTWPVWGTAPDGVLSLVRRIVDTGIEPRSASGSAEARGTVARLLVGNARRAISRAENTKDNLVRATHEIRLLLDAALDGLATVVSRDDASLLSIDELVAVAAGGPVPEERIRTRRAEIDEALVLQPAEWSVRELSVVEAQRQAGAWELSGLAGSRGTAKGRVRIMIDVDGDFDDGDVLVSAMTDTAWTPLFLAASAVVTDSGGALSHATIVARELGIPAVVNTKTATRDLADGDLVEVDGTAGVVRILERRQS